MDCPEEFSADPESPLLCELWTELQNLNQQQLSAGPGELDGGNNFISTTGNLAPVSCLYQEHTTSSAGLCSIWCQIQVFQVKIVMIVTVMDHILWSGLTM